MNIGVDASILMRPLRGGGRYLYSLLDSMIESYRQDKFILCYNTLRLTVNKREIINYFSSKGAKSIVQPIPVQILNNCQKYLNFPDMKLFFPKADIIHLPYIVQKVKLGRVKKIATIHQVTPPKYRHYESGWAGKNQYYDLLDNLAIDDMHLITVSESTKKSLMEYHCIPENKITTVYNGISPEFSPVKDVAKLSKVKIKYSLPDRYILYTGGAFWNKNLSPFIDAFLRHKKKYKNNVKLVLVGSIEWGYKKLSEQFNKEQKDNIIFTGFVAQEDINAVYSMADFFAFPSLLEGFGLSGLEAMACGCPVLASGIDVFREVFKDGAIYFDPVNVESIEEVVSNAVNGVVDREELIDNGKKTLSLYSWEKTARETMDVYRKVLSE